jgi:PAS domain S-box-containing protein
MPDEGEDKRKGARRATDMPPSTGQSISKMMAGSEERMETLHRILDHLAFDEKAAAAKVASAIAMANIIHTEMIIAADTSGKIVHTNSSEEFGLLGYKSEDLIGHYLDTIIPERFREAHNKGFKRYIETGEKHLSTWRDYPIICLHKDGSEVNMTISFEDVPVLGVRMIVGVLRKLDAGISERVIDAVADRVIEKVANIASEQHG